MISKSKKMELSVVCVFVASSLATVACVLLGYTEIAKEIVSIPGGMILIGVLLFGFLSG